MATTSPDNIEYPVNSDQVAPLASHFKNLADSTQAALNTKPDTLDLPDVIEKLNNLEYAQFDTTYTGGSTSPGMLAWDADSETLQFQLDSHVTLQIGQEHVIRVKNASGSVAIPNGTVVMFAGAAGDTVTVSPAVSDGSISINYLVGITTEQIPADGFGFVTQLGFVNGVNTDAYTVGTILYPNPAVPGGLTATEPEAPNWKIPIAAVTKKNASSGRLLVRAIGGGGGGGASVTVEETAPSVAAPGDLWLDSTDGTLYVYYEDVDGSQWIQVQANSALGASIEERLGGLESQAIAFGALSPNYVINGAFDINQRGFTSSTADVFGFDRWPVAGSGGTRTYSAQSFPAGTNLGGDEPTNFARYATSGQSAAGDWGSIYHRVEDVRTLASKTVTISFWAKAASGTPNIGVTFQQTFGTGGSSVVLVSPAVKPITSSWARYSFTANIPSVAGKTIGVGSYLQFYIFTSVGSTLSGQGYANVGIQNNTFDIWGVQLEQGSTATSFRRNGNSIQEELANCQRYFYNPLHEISANFTAIATAATTSASTGRASVVLPVTMRVAPSLSGITVGNFWLGYGNIGNNFQATSITIETATRNHLLLSVNTAGGMTSDRPCQLYRPDSTSVFPISAEL